MRLKIRVIDALLRWVGRGSGGVAMSGPATPVGADVLLDVEGYFWAPNMPERRVRGRLRWGHQVGELQLEQILRVIPNASTDKIACIQGRALLGEQLCLTDCHVRSLDSADVKGLQTWTVNGTLEGIDAPDPVIRGIDVRLAALRPFYGSPHVSVPQRGSEQGRDTLQIQWRSSPEVRVDLGDVELVFDDDWTIDGTASALSLTAHPRLRLLSGRDTSEAELKTILGPVLLFIGVFSGAPAEVRELRLLLVDGREVRSLSGRRPIVTPVGLPRPWLALGNLAPLDRTFPAWISLHEELPRALVMLAEYHRAGPASSWEDRLLYLARFVEQYHRKRHGSLRMPKAEFRARREQVRDRLDGELGTWVDGLIAHGNERRLAERLQELIDDLGDIVADALPDPGLFGQAVTDTRNYYTHYSDYLADRAATGWELVLLTKRMWLVVRALLLRELGFSDAECRALLGFDGQLGWLIASARDGDRDRTGAAASPSQTPDAT
jgi:hypothetical protein